MGGANFDNEGAGLTVAEWFGPQGRLVLSQVNGLAIWIRAANWQGGVLDPLSPFVSGGAVNSYGLGILLHEVLHKQMVGGGFNHNNPGGDPMTRALNAMGLNQGNAVGGRNWQSDHISRLCF
jgi:hypothetical protein